MAEQKSPPLIVTEDGHERRTVQERIRIRRNKDGEGAGTVTGIAAVFEQETLIGTEQMGFREQIARGAFRDAVKTDDVRALFNHDPNVVLGRTSSGSLRLANTQDGLRYSIDLPDTAAARDVAALIKRGDVTGSSFGFRVLDDDWDDKQDPPLRTIRKVELYDVSPVTFPAYPQTSVSARSKAAALVEAKKQAQTDDEAIDARDAIRQQIDAAQAWDSDT